MEEHEKHECGSLQNPTAGEQEPCAHHLHKNDEIRPYRNRPIGEKRQAGFERGEIRTQYPCGVHLGCRREKIEKNHGELEEELLVRKKEEDERKRKEVVFVVSGKLIGQYEYAERVPEKCWDERKMRKCPILPIDEINREKQDPEKRHVKRRLRIPVRQ